MQSEDEKYPLSKGEQLVNSTLGRTAKIIKNNHNLRPCGAGAAMPGGPIQQLTLCFQTKSPQTREQLRGLLIKTAYELTEQVVQNEEIQQFIKNAPFKIDDVQIIIYNNDKNGREVYDPGISTAEISHGKLTYQTVDASNTFKFKQEFSETYEEGLRALSNADHQ